MCAFLCVCVLVNGGKNVLRHHCTGNIYTAENKDQMLRLRRERVGKARKGIKKVGFGFRANVNFMFAYLHVWCVYANRNDMDKVIQPRLARREKGMLRCFYQFC